MSDLRPSTSELDGAAQLLASARARAYAAVSEIRLADELRLTEWQRSTVRAVGARLVRAVEDELRSALAGAFDSEALSGALASASVEIAFPILEEHGALASPALIEVLLRRVEEHRLHRAGAAENSLLIELAGDSDAKIAAEAMTLLIAQSSRFDPFEEPLLARPDLPAELEHELVWTVAAALRRYIVDRHWAEPAAADAALSEAALRLLGAYDEGEGLEARCVRLARALDSAGRLDGALMVRGLADASLPLFIAFLAVRTSIDAASIWEIHASRSESGMPLLLRAAGIDRSDSAAILLGLGSDEAALIPQLDFFDSVSAEEAARLLTLWRVDPGYRAALARLMQ
jgi:hypothetical protein